MGDAPTPVSEAGVLPLGETTRGLLQTLIKFNPLVHAGASSPTVLTQLTLCLYKSLSEKSVTL